jgi:NAD(P)-dependent dehydrogenase (short-subunit alcohol dehydrogenase family)
LSCNPIDCYADLAEGPIRMPVTYDFSGQTAIVTGGSRGIGRAIANQLSKSGAVVWIWDIDPVELPGTRSLLVDVTQKDEISKALAVMEDRAIDILVNDAGYLGPYLPFAEVESDEWQRILQVNLLGMFSVTQQVLPLMRHRGKGRIVNMGSLAGKEGLPNLAAYSAASAGVIAFTKALSREVSDTDIRVNCIAPGPIDTRMIRDLGNETVDSMILASPLRRLGDPDEVAALALWLCSDASAFNTGAIFDMSGGRARY